jgi:hypothetical protein
MSGDTSANKRSAQVALAGIRQHAENGRSFGACAATCSAPANVPPDVMPTKMPSFFASSLLQRIASALAIRRTWLIAFDVDASPVSFAMKSGLQPCIGCGFQFGWPAARRAVLVPLLLNPARKHRRIVRLADHDLRFRPFLGQHARHALQRAAGAESRDPVVQPLARESPAESLAPWCASACRHWLRSRTGACKTIRVSRRVRRSWHHAHRARRCGRDDHLGAQEPHQLAPLDAERAPPWSPPAGSPSPRRPSPGRCRCCRWSPPPRSAPASASRCAPPPQSRPGQAGPLTEPSGLNASTFT